MNPQEELDSLMGNIPFAEEVFDRYRSDPDSVDPSWRDAFELIDRSALPESVAAAIDQPPPSSRKEKGEGAAEKRAIGDLIAAYRRYGHLGAKINPLNTDEREPSQLNLEALGFSADEGGKLFPTLGLLKEPIAPLSEIVNVLKRIYCGSVAIEYPEGIENSSMVQWLQENIESGGLTLAGAIDLKKMILQHLNRSELLEIFLHTKYPGQKRFSLEGGETLIPILAAIVDKGAELSVEDFVIGMAHRGRLNVLSNILNKAYSQIFTEFDENYIPESFEHSGDVKYHKGFFSETMSSHGHKVHITLTPNPSHLEAVNSVVEGQVYAKQLLTYGSQKKVMPLAIHGDAAIAGQGVVYEAIQLFRLRGYGTGGTIHIIVNNQIGFTTIPNDSRSTPYCTAIARAFEIPVFHVNAEDPEGCVAAARLAVELRQRYGCDVFIDLLCYRKYGHNESDEPAFTQPLEYEKIKKKKSIRVIYRDDLVQQGVVERKIAEELEAAFKGELQAEQQQVMQIIKKESIPKPLIKEELRFSHYNTGVAMVRLQEIAEVTSTVPEGFALHPKLLRLLKNRSEMVSDGDGRGKVDWAMAELLAFGSLLWDGTHVRLSGQDSCRGTFSQRHALWVDQHSENSYYPLKHLHSKQGRFDVFNSPLSEYGVLGFEFGYSLNAPSALVLWEAQFGDFCNGAQLIIDQFIATGEQKWGQQINVVLLLPHGFEGQGPEHSSARIERFLTLSGQSNLQVVNASTPAQLFHLLRRQVMKSSKKPLVLFTPKALLRHPACVSEARELTLGTFQEILDDPTPGDPIEKVILCSGHVYYDLLEERRNNQKNTMVIIRVEQLYPFHSDRLKELLDKYRGFKELYWVQEEPSNMGAAEYMRPRLEEILPPGVSYHVVARPRSASPAVGSYALHKQQRAQLLGAVFGDKQPTIFDIAGEGRSEQRS